VEQVAPCLLFGWRFYLFILFIILSVIVLIPKARNYPGKPPKDNQRDYALYNEVFRVFPKVIPSLPQLKIKEHKNKPKDRQDNTNS